MAWSRRGGNGEERVKAAGLFRALDLVSSTRYLSHHYEGWEPYILMAVNDNDIS